MRLPFPKPVLEHQAKKNKENKKKKKSLWAIWTFGIWTRKIKFTNQFPKEF